MPKLTKDFSLHLSTALYEIAEERRKALGLSMNAYVAKCIQAEKDAAEECESCTHRTIAMHTVGILRATGALPKEPKKRKR